MGGEALLRLDGVRCVFLERVNRFVARVRAPEGESEAHVNNTGRLLEYMRPGAAAYCVPRESPGRTRYRLLAFDDDGGAALVDTSAQMAALEAAISRGLLPWALGCSIRRRSPRLGASVLDYLMDCGRRGPVYAEVKSAVLRGPGDRAMYPDCPTERGRRQIEALRDHAAQGGGALIVFVAALPRVRAFRPNGEGDPEIPHLLREAASAGVELRAVSMHYDGSLVVLDDLDLPVELTRSKGSRPRPRTAP